MKDDFIFKTPVFITNMIRNFKANVTVGLTGKAATQFHSQNPSNNHRFKHNQRAERKTSRRRKMRTGAR